MIDVDHPFFRPLWRRILITVLVLGWAVFEYMNDAPIWALVFAGIGGACIWSFFLLWKEPDDD